MTVLSYQSLLRRCSGSAPLLSPTSARTQHESGCSYGFSACGYDVRLDQDVRIHPGEFVLASTLERFHMPNDLVGIVHDKSTWARKGLALQNTVIEPGWRGYLTLEITNHASKELTDIPGWGLIHPEPIFLKAGTPVAQVLFHLLDEPSEMPYPDAGKYQEQERGPVAARDGRGYK